MGSVQVDQLLPSGTVVLDYDKKLTPQQKIEALISSLDGAQKTKVAGVNAVQWQDQMILFKQITHLGIPWESYKKRIQIPKTWLTAYDEAATQGYRTRFVGIYQYEDLTLFVDFDPVLYLQRKANNSAAHVSTNDLFQALEHKTFQRTDKNGNRLVAIRSDAFANYLSGVESTLPDKRFDIFEDLNSNLFTGEFIYGLDAVKQMYYASWPDRFQNEWAGFYLEYAFSQHTTQSGKTYLAEFVKNKTAGTLDFDLIWNSPDGSIDFLGDLKASDYTQRDALGNDALSLEKAINTHGKFWYVIYEHETRHSRDYGDIATREWNEWRRLHGHTQRKEYSPLSYSSKYKESVRFIGMKVLEINAANKHIVLGDFNQGAQQSGASRAKKVLIKKNQMDNFLVFQASSPLDALS